MIVREIARTANEPAQIAFDRAARRVKRLFAAGYSVRSPGRRGLEPGQFTLETLPALGGWKITVEPFCGAALPDFSEC